MEFGELLNQFLIDLQSLFRTHTKSLNLTLPQIMLLSSIPTDGIDMTSLSHRLGVDNSTPVSYTHLTLPTILLV